MFARLLKALSSFTLEWSINVIKQLDISSKFIAFAGAFSQRIDGSSKTQSKSNFEAVVRGVRGVEGVAGSHDVALKTDDSENRRRCFFSVDDDALFLDASL